MKVSQKGIDLIKEFEGCRLNAYKDIVGVWTIRYGHTEGLKDGRTRGIKSSDVITQEEAEQLLKDDLVIYEKGVNSLVKVELNQDMFDALVSFAFNLGNGALGGSTLLRLLNQGKYSEASDQFTRWVFADGKHSNGLIRRREAEQRLFRSGFQK